MSFEEEFDKNISQKVEDGKYPFDENNWIRASRMLDVERKAERLAFIKKFYIPSALVLFMGLSGFLVYNYLIKEPQTTEKIISVNVSATNANSNIPATNINSSEGSINKENPGAVTARATEGKIINKNNPVQETNTEPFVAKVAERSEPLQENVVNKTTDSNLPINNDNKVLVPQQPKTNNDDNAGGGTIEPVVNPIVQKPVSDNENIAGTEDTKTLNRESSNETPISENTVQEEIVSAEYLTSVNARIPYDAVDPDLNPTFGHYVKPKDEDYYSKSKKAKMHYLNAEAGASYMLGWQANTGQDAKGFNWFGGINYGFYLCKKLSIGIGLQAYNIGNIEQAFFDNTRKNYSFGSTDSYTVITTHQLYYASVPFRISYDLNANNRFGIGVNGAWLVSAKNSVETYDVLDNAKVNYVKTDNTGVYQGVRDKNVMLSVFYRSQVTSRVGINAEFTYGMTDIFENNSKYSAMQKPMGFRIGLQYTLFDK
jgi:hypothetical protein